MSDKRKGNTTKSFRNTDHIQTLSAIYRDEIDGYREMAEKRRANRKYDMVSLSDKYQSLLEYVEDRRKRSKPLTIAGILLSMDINRGFWQKMKDGEEDFLLEEYISLNNIADSDITWQDGYPQYDGVLLIPPSEIAEKATLLVQQQLEENCYTNRGNPAGSIFSLKANYRWREDEPQHVVNQLVIADSEQAKKALSMLTNG